MKSGRSIGWSGNMSRSRDTVRPSSAGGGEIDFHVRRGKLSMLPVGQFVELQGTGSDLKSLLICGGE